MTDIKDVAWDYVVVGAGSAGCVVAERLSADARRKVLLLEAGGSDRSIYVQMPAATYVGAIGNPRFDWMYPTLPDPTRRNRIDIWPRGKVLGGTSSINGMLYIRGHPMDYDGWEALGNAGWGWADVLPLFKRQERFPGGESEFHGGAGRLSVEPLRDPHPLAAHFIESARALGIATNPDLNGPSQEGVGYVQATQDGGWRCSSYRAFVAPVRARPNLKVVTDAQVVRIGLEDGRAKSASFLRSGHEQVVRVSGEIVLSAGAIASPQILLRSGVGPAEEIKSVGVLPLIDRPGVGLNLHDHPGLGITYAVDLPTFNDQLRFTSRVFHITNWLLFGRGPAATPDAHVVGFVRSAPQVDRPDIQMHFTPAGYRISGKGELLLNRSSVTAIASVCRPKSRGRLTLASPDPRTPPSIQPNLFGEPEDLDLLVQGVKRVRAIFRAQPLAGHVVEELQPGGNIESDAAISDHLLDTAATIFHPCGTCRMGVDARSVVDPQLRVRGVAGLRVADASIMPQITSGNLNAPCMMIGEKAGDLILGSQLGS
jgi:choline dehydrogenase